jgi:hypothetical protein
LALKISHLLGISGFFWLLRRGFGLFGGAYDPKREQTPIFCPVALTDAPPVTFFLCIEATL